MSSIYERVLGADFHRLHPQIQRRFGFSSSDGIASIGSGVMEEIWKGRFYTEPFLRVGSWRRIMFPETGRHIPFTIENYAFVDQYRRETVSWIRTFESRTACARNSSPTAEPEIADCVTLVNWRRAAAPSRRAATMSWRGSRLMDNDTAGAQGYLAAIVESSDDAIISKDLNGIIQSCNAAAERLFGYAAEELIGRPVRLLIPPERMAEEEQILATIRRGERVSHFETVRVRKDGRRIDVSLTISPVRDGSGHVIAASKIARDISGQKRARAAQAYLAAIVDSSEDAIIS
jgi:PAS domain S-box-containing protein